MRALKRALVMLVAVPLVAGTALAQTPPDSAQAPAPTATPAGADSIASPAGADSGSAAATPTPKTEETAEITAEVPALSAFHEVIFKLWHQAWPARDAQMARDLLPQVRAGFADVEKATLPGILRDKKDAWAQALERLKGAEAVYEKNAKGKDDQALLDAVEKLHTAFEEQVHVIRPRMKELGSYHVYLYQIFHKFSPGHQLAPLASATDSLTVHCAALYRAEPPRWFKGDGSKLRQEITTLCLKTADLKQTVMSRDWKVIEAAVQAVHSQYQKVEALFE